MADKDKHMPEAKQKDGGRPNPRKRYMSTESESEDTTNVSLQCLHDPDMAWHNMEMSYTTVEPSIDMESRRLQDNGLPMKKKKKSKTMRSTIRGCLYGVLKHCLMAVVQKQCAACREKSPGQEDHTCLSEDQDHLSKILNTLCVKICFKKLLYIIMLVAYRKQVFLLTKRGLLLLNNLLSIFQTSRKAYPYLLKLCKCGDEPYIREALRMVKGQDYKNFFCVKP
nr:uncharacterized protein LOC110071391 [Pogona vitticeps]